MTITSNAKTVANDIASLLRARNPILWINSPEEGRVERYLLEAAGVAKFVPRTWDTANGLCDMQGKPLAFLDINNRKSDEIATQDCSEALRMIDAMSRPRQYNPDNPPSNPYDSVAIRDAKGQPTARERGLWIMRDLHLWLKPPIGISPMRQLRNLARTLPASARDSVQAIVILSASTDIPLELAGNVTVIDFPLPDRAEMASILDVAIAPLPEDEQAKAAPDGERDKAIDAAIGLSGTEALACYRKSLVQSRRVDAAVVAAEKKRVVAKDKVIEWYDPLPGGLDAVGGLDVLKDWLAVRMTAYSPEARAYGLPAPKGAFLVGIPGCGKSLTAKATATAFECPLIRWDLAGNKSKFVGESEANFRKATRTIDAIGRCVVWIDEIEKALAGAINGSADGGVSADALGTFLSWLQEKQGESFVIVTANDVSQLPPELLRKGRFDEVFFVDLPTRNERKAILAAALKQYGRNPADIDLSEVAAVCDKFTGSEIASLVPDALYVAFAQGARPIATSDLLAAARTVTPLAETARERIAGLRKWAKGRARLASTPEQALNVAA